jgi:hypothetical protein
MEGNIKAATLLLQAGADVEIENNEKHNALELSDEDFRETLIPIAKHYSKPRK